MQNLRTLDKSHTVLAIPRFLEILKLQGWTHALMIWLGQYAGLECYMDPEEAPVLQVRDLLAQYVESGTRVFPKIIAADLSTLPFLHYKARVQNGAEWEPLKLPFIEFAHTNNVEVWRGAKLSPQSAVTQAYLLSAFLEYETTNNRSGSKK